MGDIFFDATIWRRSIAEYLQGLGVPIDYPELCRRWGTKLVDVCVGERDYWETFREFLLDLNLEEEAVEQADAFAKETAAAIEDRTLFDGVAETLVQLKKMGLKLAVLSDTESSELRVRQRLADLKIEQYFDAVVTSRDIGYVKPQPEAFAAAMDRLDVDAEEVIFVGHDQDELEGAMDYGLTTVAYNCEDGLACHHRIEHFSELPGLVDWPTELAEEESSTQDQENVGLARIAAKIGKLSSIYVLGQIGPRVVTVLLLPVFTYYLAIEQFGMVSLATKMTAPLTVLVHLGLRSALKMQYFRTEKASRPRLIRTVLIGQVFQAISVCTLLSLAGIWLAEMLLPNLQFYRGNVFALWVMIVWTCFFMVLVELTATLMQLHERAAMSVCITSSQFLLQMGLGVTVVVLLGWQGFGRQSTFFLAGLIASGVAFGVMWRSGRGGFDYALFKPVFRSGLTFVPHAFAGLMAVALNAWLLNRLVSPAALAVYSVAMMFPQLIQMPITSFSHAAYPTLAQLMSQGSTDAKRQQSRLYTLLITGVTGLALGVWLFAPAVIEILTEKQFHEATRVLPILVLAWFFLGLSLVVSQPVFYFGGGLWLSTATIASIIVSAVLSLILIPPYGMYGAGWAMVGGHLARLLVSISVCCYLYRLPWQVTAILRVFVYAVVVAIVSYWISNQFPPGWTISLNAVLLLTMIPALWILGVVSTDELRQGKEILLSRCGWSQ